VINAIRIRIAATGLMASPSPPTAPELMRSLSTRLFGHPKLTKATFSIGLAGLSRLAFGPWEKSARGHIEVNLRTAI